MQRKTAPLGLAYVKHERLFDTPVGPLIACADAEGLTGLGFARGRRPTKSTDDGARQHSIMTAVEAQVGEYFAGKRKAFDVPLHLEGPDFHLLVWKALLEIPYGETISYGTLARRIGEPEAARAVGAANGANPIVIIVPCHRVIGADGKLVGYGGGLKRKRVLLDLEAGRLALAMV